MIQSNTTNHALESAHTMLDEMEKRRRCKLFDLHGVHDYAASLTTGDVRAWSELHDYGDSRLITEDFVKQHGDAAIEVDLTDAIRDFIDEMGPGTATGNNAGYDFEVRVSNPDVYVVDAQGGHVPGARVMVRYQEREVELL